MSLSLKARFQFLFSHPEFKRKPLLVLFRIMVWLIYKKIGYAPKIKIHASSLMRIYPERRGMGGPGLFYVFRDQFESLIPFCVRTFVKPNSSCFDIGANVGIWTLLMSERCGGSGHVYSFEPLSRNLLHIRQNIRLSGKENITVVATALGKQSGHVQIFTPDDPARTSLAPESDNDQVEEVPLKRLDDVWEDLGCPKIAFVKMDVEGSEPFVLEGGTLFFSQCKPIVESEINSSKLANLGNKPDTIFNFFRELNYDAFQFNDHLNKLEQIGHSMDGDVVFIPR
jgi:FkbM family methyltransferase